MKYIILFNSICGVGGGQQYCRNKILELKKRNYDVVLFHSYLGEIYIDEFKKCENFLIQELKYPVCCFTSKRVNKITDYLCKIIGNDSKIIVESSSIATSEWGELIAKRLKCRHILFAIDENFEVSKSESEFLFFKLLRNELACTSIKATKKMFEKYYAIKENPKFAFKAYCANTVEDINYDSIQKIDNRNITIGFFGRLDKSYIYKSLLKSLVFVRTNNNRMINIVVIGGAPSKQFENRIRKIFKNEKNVNLFITGFLYPIPRILLSKLDVVIASAGCARVCFSEKIRTIYVNTNTGDPVGVCGYDVNLDVDNRYSEKNEKELSELIELVLNNEIPIINNFNDSNYHFFMSELNDEINRQLNLINNNNTALEYYDINLIKSETKKQKLYNFFGHVFGVKMLDFLHFKIYYPLVSKHKKN